ncbi:unnamed protein product [Lampetra fluviatilis]
MSDLPLDAVHLGLQHNGSLEGHRAARRGTRCYSPSNSEKEQQQQHRHIRGGDLQHLQLPDCVCCFQHQATACAVRQILDLSGQRARGLMISQGWLDAARAPTQPTATSLATATQNKPSHVSFTGK